MIKGNYAAQQPPSSISSMLDISAMHISKSSNYCILFYTKKKFFLCSSNWIEDFTAFRNLVLIGGSSNTMYTMYT